MSAPAASPYRIGPLVKGHNRSEFSWGEEALDRYLQKHARQDVDNRVAAAFVLTEPPAMRVLGYYTLSASGIALDDLPQPLIKKLPRYPQLPVTLLGRLAVDQSMKGRGLGQFLLMDALRRSFEGAAEIGAMAVLVDAKNEAAERFYLGYGFAHLPEQPRRMFLPMRQIAQLFSG